MVLSYQSFRFVTEEKVFPSKEKFLGCDVKLIQENWKKLKVIKFQTESQFYKPYNLMEFKMKAPLDANTACLIDEEHIFQKIQLDYAFMQNFAHPIKDPNSAILTKVWNSFIKTIYNN